MVTRSVFNKSVLLLFVILILIINVAGCDGNKESWNPGQPLAKEDVVVAVLYLDSLESGWSTAHDMGILEMQSVFGLNDDQIIRLLNVHDSDITMTEHFIETAISQGANVIIATSFGFMDACEKMAERHPNVVFAHASGYKYNDTNFTNYFGSIYQARYLAGVSAGMLTQANKIGYVAAHGTSSSEVTSGINAFAMGISSVNPDAEVVVSITHNWFDPAGERRAAQRLIAEGCDIITQHVDTLNPQIEAEAAGIRSIGYNIDVSHVAPNAMITSAVWYWDSYYTYLIGSIIDGSFTTAPFYGDLKSGLVDILPLRPFGTIPEVEMAVSEARNKIINNELFIFDGTILTNDGTEIIINMASSTPREIVNSINWYYRNVQVLH